MTKDEASFILANIDRRVCDDELNDALDMAIKSLEEPQTDNQIKTELNGIKTELESCEDCISRQAALDAMYALCDTGETFRENPWRDNPHIDAIIDALDDLPPVTPQEPKTGHWIENIDNERKWDKVRFYCSECGHWQSYGKTKYCPDCGAKMESEGNHDTDAI